MKRTHLSPPFLTEHTHEWVVVISTPVYDGKEDEGNIVGVLGLMIRLGALVKLPPTATAGSNRASSFAVLIDSRPANPGQVLQHPLYTELEGKPNQRQKLLDHAQDASLRAPPGEWQADANYRDALASVSPQYDRRWLAARLPLLARGQDTHLRVVVQESYDETIGQPLDQMRRGLILLSTVTLALVAAAIIPLWGLILRLVR